MLFSPTYLGGSPTQAEVTAPAWPTTPEASEIELARLAELLDQAGILAVRTEGLLAIPALAAGPRDTAGIRVRTTSNLPHALYVIACGGLTPHVNADGDFAQLLPLLEAAARPCGGSGAEAGVPCNAYCLPHPSTG
ncbi:hypothetical protein ACFVP0_33025 [Streptomyces cinereoruber]|uniref:hypothetical protein n=1 Tax=Streptomyces cinereoruber TaxID=67260 RepID=UPI0036AD8B82